jgi:hypothetical protein
MKLAGSNQHYKEQLLCFRIPRLGVLQDFGDKVDGGIGGTGC